MKIVVLPAVTGAPPQTLLAVYLRDHLAAAMAGQGLARRAFRNNRGTEYEAVLQDVARQVQEDRATLARVMQHLGISGSGGKHALALVAERVGRAKLNGQLRGYSPLSRLVELEGLATGVEAKRKLWESLQAAEVDTPADVDLGALIDRARAQVATLEQQRRRAARQAFRSGAAAD